MINTKTITNLNKVWQQQELILLEIIYFLAIGGICQRIVHGTYNNIININANFYRILNNYYRRLYDKPYIKSR